MKRLEALALQEGDLVVVGAPGPRDEDICGRKVLVVSSKGGVFITGSEWAPPRWVLYHHVVALGRREELTEQERASQRYEVERFQAYREQRQQTERRRFLRRRTPQALYDFVWDEIGPKGCALEALQEKARAHGLEADAATWERIGRKLGCSGNNPHFWRMPFAKRDFSVVVVPAGLAAAPRIMHAEATPLRDLSE